MSETQVKHVQSRSVRADMSETQVKHVQSRSVQAEKSHAKKNLNIPSHSNINSLETRLGKLIKLTRGLHSNIS